MLADPRHRRGHEPIQRDRADPEPKRGKRSVKRYEALFILNTAGAEESVPEIIDRITAGIQELGGKVLQVQKMDKRPFARTPNRKVTSGYYVNFELEGPVELAVKLPHHFDFDPGVYRVLVTKAEKKAEPAVGVAEA
ncbi:MAG: 30S ribosomal protein S6 [Verrucomicrobia bacterium]|nr:MAG: 30S ribosomal protein S6 [Verrucomicrobiota bacterium]